MAEEEAELRKGTVLVRVLPGPPLEPDAPCPRTSTYEYEYSVQTPVLRTVCEVELMDPGAVAA